MTTDFFTGIKPYRRDAVSAFAYDIKPQNDRDEFNRSYLRKDNILFDSAPDAHKRKPIWKKFYHAESAWFHVNQERFKLVVNPVLGFAGGVDSGDSLNVYRNSRGAEIRGSIGNKVGFYSYALENQVRFPNYLRDQHNRNDVTYGATLTKDFGEQAKDFFNVAGHITFSPIEEITVQFGNDRNFVGNGFRSLILSDQTAPYPFLKFNTKVWKINYMNLYSQHIDFRGQGESFQNGRKFSAFHHLSMNLTKNFTLGLFENIIFDRSDSTETNRYDVAYLNPIIFYRAVEHGLNSSDNASLGIDFKWNAFKRFSFYGQFLLDELVTKEFFGRTESWVNKWAYQAGMKYINVGGIQNLDLQVESNRVRPYFNMHRTKAQNWIHYNQSLAHPLGANFQESIAIIRYQPTNRLRLTFTNILSKQGIDSSNTSTNYGSDYTRTYLDRVGSIAPMFQGVLNTVTSHSLDASYMLWHNWFLDAGILFRNEDNELWAEPRRNVLFTFGMRLNLAPPPSRI